MRALIIIDVQRDFCPGGALAVPEGDAIVPGINEVARRFGVVVTTQDWHPADHGSFASNNDGAEPYTMGELSGRPQVMWPDHCVQESEGARFHPDLQVVPHNFVKGTNRAADSYSGFFDDDGAATGLDEFLRGKGISELYLCGLATDYCVKYTALDALRLGYETTVLEDLVRGVNITPEDSREALQEIVRQGGSVAASREI